MSDIQTPARRRLMLAAAAAAGTGAVGLPAYAQPKQPLLMDGKKTLFQRVLTRPGASLAPTAGAAGQAQAPFTVFYVYERVQQAGATWLLVGANADGRTQGYLAESTTVPWRHAMVVAFTPATGRNRVLFYNSRENLMSTLGNAKAAEVVQRNLAEINAKGSTSAGGVIAAEPASVVDFNKQFYILPVLEASVELLENRGSQAFKPRVLKVASIVAQADAAVGKKPPAADANAPNDVALSNFNTVVVFVLDATSSMQPYIDRTRKAVEDVYNQIEAAKIVNRVRFGVFAFQDDPAKVKGMEYLSRMFVDPAKAATKEDFLAGIGKVRASQLSTRAFAEDGYAGINDALQHVDWSRYGGRYLVYITDASAREGDSKIASAHPSTDQLNVYAREHGVAIFATHLKTPEGAKDHATAEDQYKRLSAWPGKAPNYFPIEAGDPARFETDLKAMVSGLVEQVKSPQKLLAPPPPQAAAPKAGPDSIRVNADLTGRAMVLAYLGRAERTAAPPMYEAWVSDLDVGNPATKALEARVLLTKNQLSDLQSTMVGLVRAFETGVLDPSAYFNQLRSLAVTLNRDASRIGQGKAKNLQEAGLMGEYLDGLPYRSALMSLDFREFLNKPVTEQDLTLTSMRSYIRLYSQFHDDTDKWVKLNDAATDGERVYPVPLDGLP